MDYRIAVLGDSVPWGQGLLPEQKFYSLVAVAIKSKILTTDVMAHSGAVIGANVATNQPPAPGEVPVSYPTVMQQCRAFTDSPQTVDLLLLNGGLNDVDVRFVLNPLTTSSDIHDTIVQFCYHDVKTLLSVALASFSNPATKILFLSYYPILSDDSRLDLIPEFLLFHGISIHPMLLSLGDGPLKKVVSNCQQFWIESTAMFTSAIQETNSAIGRPRVHLVSPPFSDKNAVLASDPWLWGLDFSIGAGLAPLDPMAKARHAACDATLIDPIQRFTCHRASAGHPNIAGAQQFAKAILATLNPTR